MFSGIFALLNNVMNLLQIKVMPEKESARSRIPRPMPQPFCPRGSPISELILSEEEGKEYNTSKDHTGRTISPNSYSSGIEHPSGQNCPVSLQTLIPTKLYCNVDTEHSTNIM